MKRLIVGVLILMQFFALQALDRPLKVLHVTFHEGCKNDFEEVAKEVGLNLTTWFVQRLPEGFWNGKNIGNAIYNLNPQRAQDVWDRHKDFFNTFDAIVTSDTAPLSRIFLQNNWKKPLIIWVCNRFDYFDLPTYDRSFPDRQYYELMQEATTKPNVFFAAYTPFEGIYAKRKGVMWGERVIKPLGKKEGSIPEKSFVPSAIKKEETYYIFPRLAQVQINTIAKECQNRAIKTWSGTYNGPEDLKGFRGVIFFPYAFSNLALFENLQRGVIHFVPTMTFLQRLGYMRREMVGNLAWIEWYFDEYKGFIQYFDSWDELKNKIDTVNNNALKRKIKTFGHNHRQEMIRRWKEVFDTAAQLLG